MHYDSWITFRSVTFAQRAARILEKGGIDNILRRTPKTLSVRGCGYCLYLPVRHILAATALLDEGEIPYEKAFRMGLNGPEELAL